MTIDQLLANIITWFSTGFDLLLAFDIGAMTIGQGVFTLFAGFFCLAVMGILDNG
jgi:hypothetical protein